MHRKKEIKKKSKLVLLNESCLLNLAWTSLWNMIQLMGELDAKSLFDLLIVKELLLACGGLITFWSKCVARELSKSQSVLLKIF